MSPFLPVKDGWEISIGSHAIADTHIFIKAGDAIVSVVYDPKGRVRGNPGWEVYPVNDQDAAYVRLNYIEGVVRLIDISIRQQHDNVAQQVTFC